jgi:hypothetical protein
MAVAGLASSQFVIPQSGVDPPRPSFVAGIFGGIGEFFRDRVILIAAIATVLVSSGYNVFNNMTLFTREAVGEDAAAYVGYQNALRFGTKAVAGLLLGWLLIKTHPRFGLMATGALCLASVAWVSLVPGMWFLLSFGLMGAGELWGVYYPNYILSCSPREKMRRNMAFVSMLYYPSGFFPVLYGYIADRVGSATRDARFGLQMSFAVAGGILVAALVIVQFMLPARPKPVAP